MSKEERELLIATANAVLRMAIWGRNTGCNNKLLSDFSHAAQPQPDADNGVRY